MVDPGRSSSLSMNADTESAVSHQHPDIIMNPLNFDQEVRNEDYRYHHPPAEMIESFLSEVQRIINHRDKHLELHISLSPSTWQGTMTVQWVMQSKARTISPEG